jgi:uncharacterized protein YndB with AHSA1/START domain
MNTEPLVVERTYHVPADLVWQALTDKNRMKDWYFDIPAFKAEPGFEFQFSAGNEGKTYIHLCKVTEAIPGKKLAYSWSYKDYPGHSVVSFELFPEDDKTRVKLTHTGLETFPQDKADFARASFSAGWTYILGTGLENYLSKTAN